jgi:hypothetical protein
VSTKGITLPPKKDVARALLLRGNVFVHLDPRRPGVTVPTWLQTQPQLVLQVGLDMPIPIPDLRVDDAGVYGTLSFQRAPFTCTVPWSAVFALVGDDNKGMVWPDDLPQEIVHEIDREHDRKKGAARERREREATGSTRRNGAATRPSAAFSDDRVAPEPAPALAVEDHDDAPPRDSFVESTSLPAPRPRGARKVRELPPYLRVIK